MGLMGVGTILAPALGPTLGGYLVDQLTWRWVFIAAVPFVVVSLPLARIFFPDRDTTGPRPPFDWPGAFLCGVFVVALLIGLTESQRHGWYHDPALLSLALGLVAFFAWITRVIERKESFSPTDLKIPMIMYIAVTGLSTLLGSVTMESFRPMHAATHYFKYVEYFIIFIAIGQEPTLLKSFN